MEQLWRRVRSRNSGTSLYLCVVQGLRQLDEQNWPPAVASYLKKTFAIWHARTKTKIVIKDAAVLPAECTTTYAVDDRPSHCWQGLIVTRAQLEVQTWQDQYGLKGFVKVWNKSSAKKQLHEITQACSMTQGVQALFLPPLHCWTRATDCGWTSTFNPCASHWRSAWPQFFLGTVR
jgi:hypothetical protein